MKEKINNGMVVRNMPNLKETFLVIGSSRTLISMTTVYEVFNKEEILIYKDSRKYILAKVTYDPFKKEQLFNDRDRFPSFNKYIAPEWISKDIKSERLPRIGLIRHLFLQNTHT